MKKEALNRSLEYIKDWLQFNYDNDELTGFVVAVAHKGQVLFNQSYGYANVEKEEKLTNQHLFRIASHSKTFTATALMQLQEQGNLKIDDYAVKYLPWLKKHKDKRWQKITIRQLMSHGAGVIRDGLDANYWQLDRPFPNKDKFIKEILVTDLVLDNNIKMKYSNYGYSLLGLVVEAASGTAYNDYVTKNITEKLGLKDTGPEINDEIKKNLVTGYSARVFDKKRLPIAHINTNAMSPATGFYSSAADLCKYFSAHMLGSNQLLNDESKKEMQRMQWQAENTGEKEEYGLGLEIEYVDERKVIGHGGGFPGHVTKSLFDPKDELVVIVLTNCMRSYPAGIAHGIVKVIDYFQTKWEKPNEGLLKYEGKFMNLWGAGDFIASGNKLLDVPVHTWEPFHDPDELEHIKEDEFKISKTDSFNSEGELVWFNFNASGRVEHVMVAGEKRLPIAHYLNQMSKNKQIGE
jgi:D-alanyl-D-alanine carboxypeptidase